MDAHTCLSNLDAIEKLQADIDRLQASQKMMRDANAALTKQDDAALRLMGFSEDHISDLKIRRSAGRTGFPDYAIRNNDSNIRCLKRCMATLQTASGQHFTIDAAVHWTPDYSGEIEIP
jgi:hypothetical protein